MEIGDLIKKARLEKGLTQEELGKIVGVQKSAIAKYENGRVVNIKRSTLHGLAKALDIKPSSLIGETEADKKEKSTAADDGLSDDMKQLIERIKMLPADKVRMLLQVAESIK